MNFNIPIFITAYTAIVCGSEAIISFVNDAQCLTGIVDRVS